MKIQIICRFFFDLAFYALNIIKMPTLNFGFSCLLLHVLKGKTLSYI